MYFILPLFDNGQSNLCAKMNLETGYWHSRTVYSSNFSEYNILNIAQFTLRQKLIPICITLHRAEENSPKSKEG